MIIISEEDFQYFAENLIQTFLNLDPLGKYSKVLIDIVCLAAKFTLNYFSAQLLTMLKNKQNVEICLKIMIGIVNAQKSTNVQL